MLKQLKKLREEAGVTQRQLAEAIGVSQQSINKYENHNIEPDIDTLIHIADYFNTTVDYLIGRDPLRHRQEFVCDHKLDPDEEKLLSNFRKLKKNQRSIILAAVDSYFD